MAKPLMTITASEDASDDHSILMRTTSFKGSNLYSELSWRAKAIELGEVSKDAVVSLCQERKAIEIPTIIPWNQVDGATVVTPSILSVQVVLHRYFSAKSSKKETFREAKIELFVFNCNSIELKTLIDERIQFAKIRQNIKLLIKSGSLTGKQYNSTTDHEDLPDTSDLSLGSATAADLDSDIITLTARLREIKSTLDSGISANFQEVYDNYTVVSSRCCRLQLYSVVLLLANLQGFHAFSEEEANRLLAHDFEILANIVQDDEISTANNRIEFLLDTAEVRLRDASLCGWVHRGSALEKMIECLVNGYFFEMVALLAKYFDKNNADVTSLQVKMLLFIFHVRQMVITIH